MKELKDGIRSQVRIDMKGHVHKWFRGHEKEKRCENEAHILRVLEERECPYVPRLLEHHQEDCYIVTTNCGQPAPGITRQKSDALFAELEDRYGVRHDDPEPRNVTYSPTLGRFCLIDFELAEALPSPGSALSHQSGVWRVSWASRTARGTRHKANDDAFLALEVNPEGAQVRDADGESLLEPSHLVLAVSDGMGGGRAGELASRLILARIRRNAADLYHGLHAGENTAPLLALLEKAHEGLNELAREDPGLKGMGTTLTLAWLSPGRLTMAHIGDSRLYLHRDGESEQLSKDHTRAWSDLKAGRISELAYRSHPRRSALYDVLGAGYPSMTPQIASHSLEDADRLLLCSDGIIDGLWERGIRQELSAGAPPSEVAPAVLARARECSADDDATLIVADIVQL